MVRVLESLNFCWEIFGKISGEFLVESFGGVRNLGWIFGNRIGTEKGERFGWKIPQGNNILFFLSVVIEQKRSFGG